MSAPIRILLVEDNPGDARLMREHLREVESFAAELVHADRLETARSHLEGGAIDLVLLDLSLPDAHGIDTVRQALAGDRITIIRSVHYHQYDTYFFFDDPTQGRLRYREDEFLDDQDLFVSNAYVDEGATLKRFRPRAQGRAFQIKKRTSHITVVLSTPEVSTAEAGTQTKKASK